jgi:hypothetical protein
MAATCDRMAMTRPRLVIVDPSYASQVGHHGEVNRPLQAELLAAGWQPELWTDLALEAGGVGVFTGCGYRDPGQWQDLGGMVLRAQTLEDQLALASGAEPVAAWMGHSLLPFQVLGLARHLQRQAAAAVLLSLMFAPAETLGGVAPQAPDAAAPARVALAALERACRQQGHRLTLAFPSRQQEALYAPLLAATGLASAGVHPAVVGAGQTPQPPPAGAPPLVLLHWGDLKPGKGRAEALAVLAALLEQPPPPALERWGWLFHGHGNTPLPVEERALLQRVEASGLALIWLEEEVESEAMGQWLARCPLALLAYDPEHYRQRSSGMLWQWAASRAASGLAAAGVGYDTGWLATEAAALGLRWHSPAGQAWLEALASAAAGLPARSDFSSYGQQVLGSSFASWCRARLELAV